MSRLGLYAEITKRRHDIFMACLRTVGKFKIGPTNKGGIFINYDGKDISADFSIEELKQMRDIIDDFLKVVVGEDS